MPFGLTNAPAIFQHLMETCLGNLQFQWCIIYLDDIIIFAATPKEHLERLSCSAFVAMKLPDWSCNPPSVSFSKSMWFIWDMKFQRKASKLMVIRSKLSRTGLFPSQLQSWEASWWFTNYYRCFIKGYAKVAHPLYDQISGNNATHKKQKIQWIDECQKAFDMLKVLCTSATQFWPLLTSLSPSSCIPMWVPLGWVPSCTRNRMGKIG